ncbi:F-box/LRR-repeat/kelch-repeat protein At1g09650-like [Raphanus sativus]|uniref:F-box/LRR-repeat/kelch-repeat protein At1g09650-like n=1 Tax=Raphanus sativus TaxID=3726 RepID=A0A9W3C7G9_RAPSA|nr:F-box/LRR-repeat/kelch-repeat protein At1g09650-like [Raphanus sativus]
MFSCYFLPPEVIIRILAFLPSKILPKLRLVSKQFNSIISEPYFLRLHHSHDLNSPSILTTFTVSSKSLVVELKLLSYTKPNQTALTAFRSSLLEERYHEQTQKPITKSFLGDRVRVLSSNHQLICFASDKEHFLFDPINQKTLEISLSSSVSSSSSSVVSFGFVSSTLQYKIIRFFLPYHPICKFETLTLSPKGRNYKHHLEISPWRSQETECPYLLQPYPPVLTDGSLYWITKEDPTKIVTFSLEHEKFSVLPPPQCLEDNPNHDFSLCGIRGKLLAIDYNSLEPSMEIWMMNGSNGSAWVLFPSRVKIYYPSKNEVKDFGELNHELQFCYYTNGLLSL